MKFRRRSAAPFFILHPSSFILFFSLLLPSCHRPPPPLPQRAYLWQRHWAPAVQSGLREAENQLTGVILLGAEIDWPNVVRANINWSVLKGQNVSVALRLSHYDGRNDETAEGLIISEIRRLRDEAEQNGVHLTEFQLDYDCPQHKLARYRQWVHLAAKTIHPLPFVITALPSWLGEKDFPALLDETNGYVLQVHSVPTLAESGHAALCDPALARKWVTQAANLGLPFSVSLPAYWCVAGYDQTGKLLGVAMDSIPPAWPPGTSMLEFAANADDLADLVAAWQRDPPPHLREILWYRLPLATDLRNWRWPTLAAVMAGRHPAHRLSVKCDGDNPFDLSVINNGEAEERGPCTVTVTWPAGATLTASDALTRWTLSVKDHQAIFSTPHLMLSPRDRQSLGWLRYDQATAPHCEVDSAAAR